jgi:hypothetical protein
VAEVMGLYNHCTESGDEEKGSFHASKEWLEKLWKWMSLHNVKRIRESASVDHVTLRTTHYVPQKIFNLDKTA